MTTTGYCRYRQAIPVGQGGRLDIDTNSGIRKGFLPQVFSNELTKENSTQNYQSHNLCV